MTNLVTNLVASPAASLNTVQFGIQTAFDFAKHFGLPSFILLMILVVGGYVWFKRATRNRQTVAMTPEDLKMIIRESQQPTIEGIQRIYESMRSHLRTDEVVILLSLVESLVVFQVVDLCKNLQSITFPSDEEFTRVLSERLEFLIRGIDKELHRIANVQTGTVDTQQKINTVKARVEDFKTIIRSNPRYESLKSSCEILIRGIASEHWYL